MIIKEIKLTNFRNFSNLKINFDNKINIIYGNNGKGKTNLIESIYYSSIARSFRIKDDKTLINYNSNLFVINSKFLINNSIKKIDIEVSDDYKRILLNDKKIDKISTLSKLIKIIYFYPKDVLLFKESPKTRRDFLNQSISQYDSKYLDLLIKYNYYLKERNKELKKEYPDNILLDVYSEKMCEISKYIYSYRKKYLEEINPYINYIYKRITLRDDLLKLEYNSFINDLNNYEFKFKEIFKDSKEEDIKKKTTSKGIHLEDFTMLMNNKNISKYGSQGENRIAVLSIKLAPFFMKSDEKPIVILDDVLSELDDDKKKNFLQLLEEFEQVFITNTNKIENENYLNFSIDDISK